VDCGKKRTVKSPEIKLIGKCGGEKTAYEIRGKWYTVGRSH
jgi:hypothetical protein